MVPMVNELTIVNRFVFRALHRNLASFAVARKAIFLFKKSKIERGYGGSRSAEWWQLKCLTIT